VCIGLTCGLSLPEGATEGATAHVRMCDLFKMHRPVFNLLWCQSKLAVTYRLHNLKDMRSLIIYLPTFVPVLKF